MRKHSMAIAFCSVLLLGGGVALAAKQTTKSTKPSANPSGRTYKWVDDQGVTHYGDAVPPEYAQQERSELNSQGVEVNRTQAQMTPEQAAVAQQSAAEEARKRQRDQFLLTTYTTASDIEQLRDERLALLDGQMSIARGSIASLDSRLQALEKRMSSFSPYSKVATARRMPDQLAEEVVRALRERRSLDETLTARDKEKSELRAQFDADLARYRELTANRLPR